ncbi:hypothetical protein Chor_011226 [Crotalus horridus]
MQHPLDLGAAAAAAHYFPADPFVDHRSHRYRSFMIEEILTDHPDAKSAAPAGELLKFGVKALLSTRPYHNPLGNTSLAVSLLRISPNCCRRRPPEACRELEESSEGGPDFRAN